jgi:hypothetical protein
MTDSELDAQVEAMAELLGAPCVLEDRDFALLAFAAQDEVDEVRRSSILRRHCSPAVHGWFHAHGIRSAREPVRTPGDAALGIAPRLCIPARHRNRVYGYFWVIDLHQSIPSALFADAMKIADTAGLIISQQSRHRLRTEMLVRDLFSGDPSAVRKAAADLALLTQLETGEPLRCVAVAGPPDVLDEAGHRVRDGVLWVRRSPGCALAATTAHRLGQERSRDEVVSRLTRLGEGRRSSLRCGLGPEVAGLADLSKSWSGARVALRVAHSDPNTSRISAWDDLGVLRLLEIAPPDELRRTILAGPIGSFVTAGDPVLIDTARAYLDAGGAHGVAAAALNVHRQTLYQRLDRVARAANVDLTSGMDRLQLHLALTMRDFA